jgi:hypothetical protein
MKRSLVAIALAAIVVALSAGVASAAPGDPRVLQGTLEWPGNFSAEPFVVVRGDDGRLYYVDLGSAQRRSAGALTAGSRVTVVGVEGARPYEVAAMVIGLGDAAALGLQLPPMTSSPSAPSSPAPGENAPPLAAPSEPMWRVDGTVQSVAGKAVTLLTADGATATVDVSQLSESTRTALRQGERVSLFGVPRSDHQLVANGYLQSEPPAPAASPRSTR